MFSRFQNNGSHPYTNLPSAAVWRKAVVDARGGEVDLQTKPRFQFSKDDVVVTAGSCFAQHIGRYLQACGCRYLVTEPSHPVVGPKAALALNYGVYTARYGNIYTPRQLNQLFDRAFGVFFPKEDVWKESDGSLRDPFRPNIQPGGFNGELELQIDRKRHFRAVRDAFERLSVFVFTLGLTEAWLSRVDGAVFPVCPGVSGGRFDASRHEFINFDLNEVVCDLRQFVDKLRNVNKNAKVIFTVSPVPLAATAERRHVQVSTTYSKSVLRVACDEMERADQRVAYFPSYEVITGSFSGKDFFASDRRSVTDEGVAVVMSTFRRHFITTPSSGQRLRRTAAAFFGSTSEPSDPSLRALFELQCDEEALDLKDDV